MSGPGPEAGSPTEFMKLSWVLIARNFSFIDWNSARGRSKKSLPFFNIGGNLQPDPEFKGRLNIRVQLCTPKHPV
jgi:hypothetical protein